MATVKDKETILKAARTQHQGSYKGNPVRLSADFSEVTLQARREWQEIFKVLKGRNLQPRLLHPAGLSFRIEEEREFSRHVKTKGAHHH